MDSLIISFDDIDDNFLCLTANDIEQYTISQTIHICMTLI